MPNYFYKAKNIKGEEKQGFLEAVNSSHLARMLREQEYFLISADDKSLEKKKKKFALNIFERMLGVSMKEKLFFTKNLALMIKTGVPLPRSFEILIKQAKSKKFKEILKEISQNIIKGQNLSEALSHFPEIFPKIYQETLKVGEETGKIEDSLNILAKQMEREYNLKTQIKTAMVYPLVVLLTAVFIGIVMFAFVVPNLKVVFSELKVKLPFTTKAMFFFSEFLIKEWPLVISICFILFFVLAVFLKKGKGGKIISKIILIIPVLSKISKDINSALTLRILSSLFAAGVPIVYSLEITSGSLGNFYFKSALLEAANLVKKGKKFSQALEPYENLYSPLVLEMIKVGEETGETSQVLETLADFYEKEVNATLEKLSSIIEPLLILTIGAIVGFFAVSMLQPIFSIVGGM
ncbi:type II secretion system F family protein [Patescibacteria group bacterium]|nr:type II secretion system F family protein [Patescibacteria group bacterium]